MAVRLFSASIQGIDAHLVEVEVDSTPGLHAFSIVGLPDKAVQESKERIGAAVRNNNLVPPSAKSKKILVNLAPADLKKEGPAYDLPIALGYLLETEQVKFDPKKVLIAGELSLNGEIKPINGVLAMAILAKNKKFKELIIPADNAVEASLVEGINIVPVSNIAEVAGYLSGQVKNLNFPSKNAIFTHSQDDESFDLIKGQEFAKRALMVAAAGGHNILLNGPPGTGKTLLARALIDLLPPLSRDEAIEVAKIYSSLGLLSGGSVSFTRPFRSPHHTTSAPAVVGGGNIPRPGEISLAHRGVLFLDELPEFPRNVLESLRQPLEEGKVSVSRASGSMSFPAKFILVAAMNPCPCGNFGNDRNPCICLPQHVLKYRKKISGPLLDRIDIQVNVPRETHLASLPSKYSASIVRKSIQNCRDVQTKRYTDSRLLTNSEISYKEVDKHCRLESDADSYLKDTTHKKGLSLRTVHKIKKLARTIADLDESENITQSHVVEAIALKVNDKLFDGHTI